MATPKSIAAMATLILSGSISIAQAGQSYSMDGSIANVDSGGMKPIDQMHVIVESKNTGTISLSDSANPLNGASGSCSGTMLIQKGKLTGGGYCAYKDADGDTGIVSFTAESVNEKGTNSGNWVMIGGTGKYANASANGKYSSTPNEARTESVNTISGTLTIN